MAKKPKGTVVNVELMHAIKAAGDSHRVSKDEASNLVENKFVEVNTTAVDAEGKAPARLTDAGHQYLNNLNNKESQSKPMYGIMKGITIPESKRGNRKGAGAPTVYPFEAMEVGDTFFVPNSEKEDAAKRLGSTVSQQNMKYRVETGDSEVKEITKRGKGNKAEVDAEGNKIKETKTVPVYKQTRRYVLRAVKKGQVLGEWTAPDDGALIGREM